MKLVIYGAGGQGRVLLRFAREINAKSKRWDEIIFADDVVAEKTVMGQRVFPFKEIPDNFSADSVEFVISLGEPVNRKALYERVRSAGFAFCEPITATEEDLSYNRFGNGVVISKNSSITNNACLGDNTYVGNSVLIGHDSTVGKHCFICGSASIGGGCEIGEGTFIGLNATVGDHLKIGSNVIISMGACVFKDLPDGAKALGNPAQVVPNLKDSKIFY